MPDPLVSIIIPCYQQGNYVGETIQSVLNQTYPNIEIIVVNDGSDDNTDEVARSFQDKICYIEKTNAGLPAARNSGIARATGKYLLFLDSDDLLHSDSVSWLVEAAQGRDDCLVVMGYRLFRDSPEQENEMDHKPGKDAESFPLLIHRNWGPPHGYLSSRSIVTEIGGFDESLRSCEDWDFWIRQCFAGAHWIRVTKVGAYYRKHGGQMTENLPRMLSTAGEVLMRIHREIKGRPDLLEMWGHELLQAEYRMLRRCIVGHAPEHEIAALYAAIQELLEIGVPSTRNPIRRMIDSLLGCNSERIALMAFRLFKPDAYIEYCRSPSVITLDDEGTS